MIRRRGSGQWDIMGSDRHEPTPQTPGVRRESAARDNRPLADRRSHYSNPLPEAGDEFAGEHEPSETDPAARSPLQTTRDNQAEWPTRA